MIKLLLAFLLFAVPASAQSIRDDLWVTNGLVNASTILDNTMYVGGNFTRVGPATGGFMPTDVATGRRLLPSLGVDGAVNAVVSDGAGGFYLGGSFKHCQGVARANLARVDADGVLNAWNPGVNGIVRAIAVGFGRVYIGGDFTQVRGIARTNAAAIGVSADTVLTSWAPNPTLPVHTIAYLNHVVYMGGEFLNVAGTSRAYAGAFDDVTGTATPWQPNGNGPVYALALFYDGTTTAYLGGKFTFCGGVNRRNFAVINATPGSLGYSSALPYDPSPDGPVRALRIDGSTVYAGGEFKIFAGLARNYVSSFQGSFLTGFNPSPNGPVLALAPSGNSLFIGGSFTTVGATQRAYGAQVDVSTSTAMPWDAAAGNVIRAFAQSGTTMWIGGDFTTIGALTRSNLAALDLTSGAATTWNPGATAPVLALEAIRGQVYVGGQFVMLGGQAHQYIGRVDVNGNADAAWTPNTNSLVYAIAGGPSVVYLGGAFTSCAGQSRGHLAAVSDVLPLSLTPWNPNAGTIGDVRALAVDESYVYAGGSFSSLGGQMIAGLGRADLNGVASAWNPQTQIPIQAITLTPTTLYIGFAGTNNLVGGQRIGVAELAKSTGAVTSWAANTEAGGVVRTIRKSGGTVYIGGQFNTLAGQPRSMLGAVDAVTGAALPFDPAPSTWLLVANPPTYAQAPTVIDLEEDNGRLYAAGQFTDIGGKPHSGVAGIFESSVGVEPGVPIGLALRATPNPASAGQTLEFTLPRAGFVTVEIHNVAGRLVRSFSPGLMNAGPHRIPWDGRDAEGLRLAPGIFFVGVEAGTESGRAKVLRLD